jgi:type II secretory pathway component PulK
MTPRRRRQRRAAVLLVVLLLVAITTPLLCMLLDAHTTQIRCIHNQVEAARVQYLAEAGVQDAMGELLLDSSWRTGFTNKEFPAGSGHTYTVTVDDGGSGLLTVTSVGRTAGGAEKTVTAQLVGF